MLPHLYNNPSLLGQLEFQLVQTLFRLQQTSETLFVEFADSNGHYETDVEGVRDGWRGGRGGREKQTILDASCPSLTSSHEFDETPKPKKDQKTC